MYILCKFILAFSVTPSCSVALVKVVFFCIAVICLQNTDGIISSVDPDQTAPKGE